MSQSQDFASRCLLFGWAALAVFAIGGLALETLHLVKAPLYMEVRIRRELWTLAHAHGVLLALITIVFGLYAKHRDNLPGLSVPSKTLRASALLIPAGFGLGGIGNAETDPSIAIILVPLGALLLIYSVAATALVACRE